MMIKDSAWNGLWWIKGNYGGLCLLQSVGGGGITGRYAYGGGIMHGDISGRVLTGTWEEDRPNKCTGRLRIVISHNGQSVTGHWWFGSRVTRPKDAESWVMVKKQPNDFKLRW